MNDVISRIDVNTAIRMCNTLLEEQRDTLKLTILTTTKVLNNHKWKVSEKAMITKLIRKYELKLHELTRQL